MSVKESPVRGRFFYGWWIVFSAAAINLLTGATFFYGFGVFFTPILTEFSWTNTQVALAMSLRSEVSAFAAPVVGYSVDRFGVRKIMTIGVLVVGVGLAFLSRVWDLPSFYLAMCLIALGTSSTGGVVGILAISRWFDKKRSRAIAFMTLGAGFSGVVVPVIAILVLNFGWRTSLLVLAALMVIVCLPLAQLMRDRPEAMGVWPDGAEHPPGFDADLSDEENEQKARELALEGMSVREAVHSRMFWQLTGAMTLASLSNNAVLIYQVPVLQHSGISTELAAFSVTGLTLMSLTGRMGFGWLGDFFDKRKVMAFCFALQCAGLTMFAALGPLWLVIPFLITFSPGFGGPIPLRPALMAEYFGIRALGSIQGAFILVNTLGAVAGPVLVGLVFDNFGTYSPAFFGMAALNVLAIPLILTLPRAKLATGRFGSGNSWR